MSNKTQLQTNNTALDGYITRINTAKEVAAGLPEAGGSGGGGMETCTVTTVGFNNISIAATIVNEAGNLEALITSGLDDDLISNYNFLKGSTIVFIDENWAIIPAGITATGADEFGYYMQGGIAVFHLISDTATFTFVS